METMSIVNIEELIKKDREAKLIVGEVRGKVIG